MPQLTRPSPNDVPPAPPEGMRQVWHSAGEEWVLDAALPPPRRTLIDAVCENPVAKGIAWLGAAALAPFVWLFCAIGVFWAGWGLFWLLAQFGMGPMS